MVLVMRIPCRINIYISTVLSIEETAMCADYRSSHLHFILSHPYVSVVSVLLLAGVVQHR